MQLSPIKQYGLITASYWAFTITDGALRMLVLLFFYQLGYSPLEIAMLFVLYEFFGMVTNLIGGWLGARLGLKLTMNVGLVLQIIALMMLTVDPSLLTIVYVMLAQALSGIAKDLNKMSAKSAIKSLAVDATGQLYRWVSLLTGSKNALKGVGFFVGAFLLSTIGFTEALQVLALLIFIALIISLLFIDAENGKELNKSKFSAMFSKTSAINWLSAARFFLFGARDIWFVVALPIYLISVLGWQPQSVGAFMALWIIGYGFVQAIAPKLTGLKSADSKKLPNAKTAMKLALLLALIPIIMATLLVFDPQAVILIGLFAFGVIFALNSAVHSYLIVSYADADGTSKDVGFYYMANAGGRLIGVILSGLLFQWSGMEMVLLFSAGFVLLAALIVIKASPNIPMKCSG